MKKYQDGGRTISEKAAMRKVSKGKGTIAYKYGSDSAPGTEGNKGEYIGYSRKARKDSASGKTMGTSMKDAKPARRVMQSGGTSGGYPESGGVRQMQKGGPTDGPSVSSKGAFYPDAKCRGEGCPKNPNDPKYKNQVAKLSAEDRKKIGVKYKTGGMVNPNANLQAGKKAGSKGVKSGVNPKAAASKVAKGRSGGTSAAPKTAIPKAKYGMTLKKKQDGGPQDYVDRVIAQKMKSAVAQKGMNQARVAAKKGRAGKI